MEVGEVKGIACFLMMYDRQLNFDYQRSPQDYSRLWLASMVFAPNV